MTSYYFEDPATDAYLRQVQRHAFLRGVSVSGTAIGNTFTLPAGKEREKKLELTRTWIADAAVIGAPHIRVFAGEAKGSPKADAKRRTIEALEEMGDLAGRHGIFLGVENHGGIVAEADDLLEIVRTVRSLWVGINLDIGNFNTTDPYADIARCALYAGTAVPDPDAPPASRAQLPCPRAGEALNVERAGIGFAWVIPPRSRLRPPPLVAGSGLTESEPNVVNATHHDSRKNDFHRLLPRCGRRTLSLKRPRADTAQPSLRSRNRASLARGWQRSGCGRDGAPTGWGRDHICFGGGIW